MNFARVQRALDATAAASPGAAGLRRHGFFIGFHWGATRASFKKGELRDAGGARALWNASEHMNFGQEADLKERTKLPTLLHTGVFVHHYRGQTLGLCKNGQVDCATWQVGHKPGRRKLATAARGARRAR